MRECNLVFTADCNKFRWNLPPLWAWVKFITTTAAYMRVEFLWWTYQCSITAIIVIWLLWEHGLQLTVNCNQCWLNSRLWNSIRSGTIVHCFARKNGNYEQQASFINTGTKSLLKYYNFKEFCSESKTVKDWLLILKYQQHWSIKNRYQAITNILNIMTSVTIFLLSNAFFLTIFRSTYRLFFTSWMLSFAVKKI